MYMTYFRLTFYDRNNNFGKLEDINDGYVMKTPATTQYKDINSQTKVFPNYFISPVPLSLLSATLTVPSTK